jgi:hypothetical protein
VKELTAVRRMREVSGVIGEARPVDGEVHKVIRMRGLV